MRTTLNLPEGLIEEAMKVSHQKTKTATIIFALQDMVRRSPLQKLRRFKGRVDLDDEDLKALRAAKAEEADAPTISLREARKELGLGK